MLLSINGDALIGIIGIKLLSVIFAGLEAFFEGGMSDIYRNLLFVGVHVP